MILRCLSSAAVIDEIKAIATHDQTAVEDWHRLCRSPQLDGTPVLRQFACLAFGFTGPQTVCPSVQLVCLAFWALEALDGLPVSDSMPVSMRFSLFVRRW